MVAGPIAGAAVAGAITGVGNSLTGGGSIGEAIGQGIVGGATGMLGGMLAGPLSGVISSKLSSVIGSTASGIVANITTSAAGGGAFGAGMSVMNGGTAWQGFVNGMRMGAITGAISSAVPAAINALKKPEPIVPKEVEVETPKQESTVKTEQPGPSAKRQNNRLPSATLDRGNSEANTTKPLKFTGDEAVKHFGKHAQEIMKAAGKSNYDLKNYVDDANWIIQHGTYSSKLNGYYYFISNSSKGTSLFGFVGLKNGGTAISTFYIKTATQLGLK